MIRVTSKGNFNNLLGFFNRVRKGDLFSDLDHYGQMGVDALARATPVHTGLTARSWNYQIIEGPTGPTIEWYNTNVVMGNTPVVILLQYGHGTGTGGYVAGRDFINPAIQPIFDKIAADVWKKVNA